MKVRIQQLSPYPNDNNSAFFCLPPILILLISLFPSLSVDSSAQINDEVNFAAYHLRVDKVKNNKDRYRIDVISFYFPLKPTGLLPKWGENYFTQLMMAESMNL